MTDKPNIFPARLHVILAREKDVAVVIRRGPSKQVATFFWDRRNDNVQLGQWLKGRIYERRTDLSPNGQHMIYFAMNGKWESETHGTWTAVSKAPYLKALDLYAKGDCWEGGGLFLSNDRYWLNDRYFSAGSVIHSSSTCRHDREYRPELNYGSECTGVYYPRLIRDGWLLTNRSRKVQGHSQTVFEKPLRNDWTLRKIAHEQVNAPAGKGCYWDEHELFNSSTDTRISCPEWEWAEQDKGRIIWAEAGKLYSARLKGKTVLGSAELIHDFNPYTFQAVEAPY